MEKIEDYSGFSHEMENIRSEFAKSQEKRDSLIKKARDLVSLSKKAIYAVHRKDMDSANKYYQTLTDEAMQFHNNLDSAGMAGQNHGFASNALQEYVEAAAFKEFFETRRIMEKPKNVDSKTYLTGLCDLSGELMRMAINNALSDKKLFDDCKRTVSLIFDELMLFDLPNSELRRKFDSLKYAVKKLEETSLEMGMRNG